MDAGLVELPFGLTGRIYRSPLPLSPYYDPEQRLLASYLQAGVTAIVMLTPEAEAQELTGYDLRKHYQDLGFEVIYSPIVDFSVPGPKELQAPIRKTLELANSGRSLAIHCHAGVGRTGLFAACLAKALFGMDGDEAIAWVRQYIPSGVENNQQSKFVKDFDYHLD